MRFGCIFTRYSCWLEIGHLKMSCLVGKSCERFALTYAASGFHRFFHTQFIFCEGFSQQRSDSMGAPWGAFLMISMTAQCSVERFAQTLADCLSQPLFSACLFRNCASPENLGCLSTERRVKHMGDYKHPPTGNKLDFPEKNLMHIFPHNLAAPVSSCAWPAAFSVSSMGDP